MQILLLIAPIVIMFTGFVLLVMFGCMLACMVNGMTAREWFYYSFKYRYDAD